MVTERSITERNTKRIWHCPFFPRQDTYVLRSWRPSYANFPENETLTKIDALVVDGNCPQELTPASVLLLFVVNGSVRIWINLVLLASLGFNLVLLALLSYITSEDISLFDYCVWLVITFHVLCSDLS